MKCIYPKLFLRNLSFPSIALAHLVSQGGTHLPRQCKENNFDHFT